MKKDDGGYAFPNVIKMEGMTEINRGMSLRDWFAGMALQGNLASTGTYFSLDYIKKACKEYDKSPGELLAIWSYSYADYMIAERNKE